MKKACSQQFCVQIYIFLPDYFANIPPCLSLSSYCQGQQGWQHCIWVEWISKHSRKLLRVYKKTLFQHICQSIHHPIFGQIELFLTNWHNNWNCFFFPNWSNNRGAWQARTWDRAMTMGSGRHQVDDCLNARKKKKKEGRNGRDNDLGRINRNAVFLIYSDLLFFFPSKENNFLRTNFLLQ